MKENTTSSEVSCQEALSPFERRLCRHLARAGGRGLARGASQAGSRIWFLTPRQSGGKLTAARAVASSFLFSGMLSRPKMICRTTSAAPARNKPCSGRACGSTRFHHIDAILCGAGVSARVRTARLTARLGALYVEESAKARSARALLISIDVRFLQGHGPVQNFRAPVISTGSHAPGASPSQGSF
jgi:hypothetical protein